METATEPKQYVLRLGANGQLELPISLIEQFRLEEGDELTLFQIDGMFFFSPKPLVVPEMASKIADLREEAGLSVEDLIGSLESIGQELYQEQYGQPAPA